MINFTNFIADAKFISGDEYGKYWNKFEKMGVKAKKLEFLQTYEFIDGNEDFKNKKYDKFLEMLKDFHKNAWGGKDNIKRIHFVEYPLDEYLQMEYYTYLINETYGQDIRITSDRHLFPDKTYDFVLFENGNLFILDFGNNDSWNGAWHITDEKIINKVSTWYDKVFSKSTNFKSMMQPNDYLMKRLKENNII